MTEPLAYLERLALDLRDEGWKITADRLDAVREALAEEPARWQQEARVADAARKTAEDDVERLVAAVERKDARVEELEGALRALLPDGCTGPPCAGGPVHEALCAEARAALREGE